MTINNEILAIFRSRAQAIDAQSKLRSAGIYAVLVNTPSEANIGCGLSVKLPLSSLVRAKTVIARGRYSAFYGYFTLR